MVLAARACHAHLPPYAERPGIAATPSADDPERNVSSPQVLSPQASAGRARSEKLIGANAGHIQISRLVARLHLEIQFADKLWEFVIVAILVICFCAFAISLDFPAQRQALEVVRGISSLDHGNSGKFTLQNSEMTNYLRTLAGESNLINPASPRYSQSPARLLVAPPTDFVVPTKLSSQQHFDVGTGFTITGWVKYTGNGNGASILRKVRISTSGEQTTCWEALVEPLTLRYRVFIDAAHSDWAGKSVEGIDAQIVSYVNASTESPGPGFHFVALAYEYNITTKSVSVRFGIDGNPMSEALEPDGYQPFPLTDCGDGEMMIGSPDVEIADLLFIPRAISEEHYLGLYTGASRPMTATTTPEQLGVSDFEDRANEARRAYTKQMSEELRNHRQFMWDLRPPVDSTAERAFRAQDYTCNNDACEVRVFPKGKWYAPLDLSQAVVVVKPASASCTDGTRRAHSEEVPTSSERPVGALLDRYLVLNVSSLAPDTAFRMCWQESRADSSTGLDIGMLTYVDEVVDYVEFIGDASVTFNLGHSQDSMTKYVGKEAASTVTMWVHYTANVPTYPYLFMKTLTAGSDVIGDNVIWSIYTEATGPAYFWKEVYGGDFTDAPGDTFIAGGNGCFPAPDLRQQMTHVAYVHLASENKALLYIDGSLCKTFEMDPASGYDATKLFEDGDGNLTIGSGRPGSYEYTGDMKQVRFYRRGLTAGEIATLASNPVHRVCHAWDDLRDSYIWKDALGKSCVDYARFDAMHRADYSGPACPLDARGNCPAACSLDAEINCPVACSTVPKCYIAGVDLPKVVHLFPRHSWTASSRLCLAKGLTSTDIMDRCKALIPDDMMPRRQAEFDNKAPWMWSDEEVIHGNRMCQRVQLELTGSDTCPLDMEEFQSRWNSGEDWTLLWSGGYLTAFCSILQPTKRLLVVSEESYLYTNATSGTFNLFAVGDAVGWSAISVSKSRNKLVAFREGRTDEKTFDDVDPDCAFEALRLSQVDNLRMVPTFYSVGELTNMYYTEIRAKRLGYEYKPLHNDMTQFSPPTATTFAPFDRRVLNLLPPIVWHSKNTGEVVEDCSPLTVTASELAVRIREQSIECDGSSTCRVGDVLPLACRSAQHVTVEEFVGADEELFGQMGEAFELSDLNHVVLHKNHKLHDPIELVGRSEAKLYVIFVFFSAPDDLVYTVVELDRTASPIKGQVSFTAFAQPSNAFWACSIVTLVAGVLVVLALLYKVIKRQRRIKELDELHEKGVDGLPPSKNQEDTLDYLRSSDPEAGKAIGGDFTFSALSALGAIAVVCYCMVCVKNIDYVIMEQAVPMTHSESSLSERMEIFRSFDIQMGRIRDIATINLIVGFCLLISLISLFGFHMRMAIVIRSLKRAASPLAHFMLIFVTAGILASLFMFTQLSAIHDGYATSSETVNTQINFFMGDRPHTDVGSTAVNVVSHTFTVIFFMLVLLNMFTAIVLTYYQQEFDQVEKFEGEYALYTDLWLFVRDAWGVRWGCRKKWFLAHVFSTTRCPRTVAKDAKQFIEIFAGSPLVTASTSGPNGATVYQVVDKLHGEVTFTQRELTAYFRVVKRRDVLWPPKEKRKVEEQEAGGEPEEEFDAPAQREEVAGEGRGEVNAERCMATDM